MKIVATAVVGAVVIAAAVLAHLHVVSQRYYPTVKVIAPEGVTYLVVQDPTEERQACGSANRRFIAPVMEHCKRCEVAWARCERVITGEEEAALLKGVSNRNYLLVSAGFRLAIIAPEPIAKTHCDYLLGVLNQTGVRTAACIQPNTAPTS